MKKLLFILFALACLAWSDNYGGKGSYGSTAYGETSYGCSSGYSCSSEKDGAKKVKKSGKAAPSSSSSSMTLGSFLGNLVPTANSASSASGTPAAKPTKKEPEPLKPYKFRLAAEAGRSFYDADIVGLDLGYLGNFQFFMRSGEGRFYIEYGLGSGAEFFNVPRYDDPHIWWNVLALDALFQLGIELGGSSFRFGTYLGGLFDYKGISTDDVAGHGDGPMLENNYHYGVSLGWAYRFSSHFELGVVFKDDLSEINSEIGNMKFGKRGFASFAITGGMMF